MLPLFDDIIGHEQIREVLSRVVTRPGQAYLFHGAQGIGKRMVAERFAAALLFSADEQQKIQRSHLAEKLLSHPDFIRFTREEGTKEFSVRQVRELLQRLSLSSARGGKMVVLIDEADTLNEEGCNALLKTVEEPSAALVFLFLTERPDRLPATLRSRLAPLAFARVPKRELATWLKTVHEVADPEALAEAARGCPGRALEHLKDLSGWRISKQQANAVTEQLLHGDIGLRLLAIDRLVMDAERRENPAEAWYTLLEQSEQALREEWLSHPLETVRMARGLIHASKLVGGSLSPRFALEWNGTLPLVPRHFIPRSLDSSSLFSL